LESGALGQLFLGKAPKNGNPNGSGLMNWPALESEGRVLAQHRRNAAPLEQFNSAGVDLIAAVQGITAPRGRTVMEDMVRIGPKRGKISYRFFGDQLEKRDRQVLMYRKHLKT
jgi:hypothetical protein